MCLGHNPRQLFRPAGYDNVDNCTEAVVVEGVYESLTMESCYQKESIRQYILGFKMLVDMRQVNAVEDKLKLIPFFMLRTDSSQREQRQKQKQELATMYGNLATEDCFNKAELKKLNLRQVIVIVIEYPLPDHTRVQP